MATQAVPCPTCGAPLAVTLASLRGVRCRACGFEGPPPPAAEIKRRSSVIGASARRAALASGALVIATPFVGFASVLGVLLLAETLEPVVALAPSPLARYAFVDTKRGRCVGLIARRHGETLAHFGGNDRLPNPSTIDEGDAAELELFPATALVGRRVRLANGTEGVVTKALGAPLTNREQSAVRGRRARRRGGLVPPAGPVGSDAGRLRLSGRRARTRSGSSGRDR